MAIATQEQTHELIEINVDENALDQIDLVSQQCSLEAVAALGALRRTMRLAAGLRMLRKLIDGPVLDELMSLQGSRLGFKTDKDNVQTTKDGDRGYPREVVRNCAIEATLRGAMWVGNEFNIIAGNAYFTKEFFQRKCREFPGVTELTVSPGVPKTSDGGALVPYVVTWKLNGVPKRLEKLVRKLENGTELDERICVRVNQGMGADAILGKAERKALAAVYRILTNSDVNDGDADDAKTVTAAPRSLDQLTDRLTGQTENGTQANGNGTPSNGNGDIAEPPKEDAKHATPLEKFQADIAAAEASPDQKLTKLAAVLREFTDSKNGHSDTTIEVAQKIYEEARQRVKSGRPQQS